MMVIDQSIAPWLIVCGTVIIVAGQIALVFIVKIVRGKERKDRLRMDEQMRLKSDYEKGKTE